MNDQELIEKARLAKAHLPWIDQKAAYLLARAELDTWITELERRGYFVLEFCGGLSGLEIIKET